jgi:zinc/manganese transport system substrate-binding protein
MQMRPRSRIAIRRTMLSAVCALATMLLSSGAGRAMDTAAAMRGALQVVASTNVYAGVIAQLGGSHVQVTGILSNPNTDPHTYESSTADASAVARATLILQNGLGYDDFMQKLEAASPNARRTVIDVGKTLGYRTGDNPHIWYSPTTMPRIAPAIVVALARQDPADAATFRANLKTFDASLRPWTALLAQVKQRYSGTPVAITEPVFGYAVQAMGLKILTPDAFALAIMEGNDPSPQDVQVEKGLFTGNRVKVFFYNQQAVAPITVTLLGLARAHHIPIVGVYETRPPAKTYQQWMLAEVQATQRALATGASTEQMH